MHKQDEYSNEQNQGNDGHDDNDNDRPPLEGPELSTGSSLGSLGMLVLELSEPAADFAAMKHHPTYKPFKERCATADWSPSDACSKATRHYIVADECELIELCDYLCVASPHLRELLLPSSDSETPEEQIRRQASNSLSGPVERLSPEHTHAVQSLSSMAARALASSSSDSDVPPPPPGAGASFKLDSEEKVHDFLSRCGVTCTENSSRCVKAALLN
jgi:hypothetical protein